MGDSLRAGITTYNAGVYRAAHGAWESRWLSLKRDIDDEQFLHGPIQFTAVVHRARSGNNFGAVGLARSVREYLDDLADDHRGVDLANVRESLVRLEADPDAAANPPVLRLNSRIVAHDDFDFDAAAVATEMLVEELDGYDEPVVADVAGYAYKEITDGKQTQFTVMVFGFVRNEAQRGLAFQ